jgi:signal transduction histidine kinase
MLKSLPHKLTSTLKMTFTSRLSRQLGLWVFVCILGTEVVIFLPSAYRRKYEQLNNVAVTSQTTVDALALSATPSTLLPQLQQLNQQKHLIPLLGGTLYRSDGQAIAQVGAVSHVMFNPIDRPQNQLFYRSPWQYQIATKVTLQNQSYDLRLVYDVTAVRQDLIDFALRILGLVILISVSVTILMIAILNHRVIAPILLLQSDVCRSGKAIAAGEALNEFASMQYKTQNELQEVIDAFHQTHQQIVAVIAERERSQAALSQTAAELQTTLVDLQQTQAQLVHTEKMSSLGQLGAGFAHEINNPINFIDANLKHVNYYSRDLLALVLQYQQELPSPSPQLQQQLADVDLEFMQTDLPALIRSMTAGATRIRDLVVSFRNFVRLDEADEKVVDIHAGIDSALLLLSGPLAATKARPAITIQRDYAPLPAVRCYPKQLNQAFMYLLTNAIEAIDQLAMQQSFVHPLIQIVTADHGGYVLVEIIDNGVGILPAIQAKIFDPFFTTKDVGQGMGLGLTNSYRIIKEIHQGELTCDGAIAQGARLLIQLPKAD